MFHVTEDEVKSGVDQQLYESEIGVAEMVLDVPVIKEAVKKVRERSSTPVS